MPPSELDVLAAALPTNLVLTLKYAGLAEVASAVSGVPVHDEYAVYQKIGADLFARRLEHRAIMRGLASLQIAEQAR